MNDHMTINHVLIELERVKREGLPYDGPEIKWMCSQLAATCPEPHIALGAEYLGLNEDLIADEAYVNQITMWVQYEAGYRNAVETLKDGLDVYAHRIMPMELPTDKTDKDPRLSPLANVLLDWVNA